MMNRRLTTAVLAGGLLSASALSVGAAELGRHSGTVLSLDPGTRTLVLAEVGPWRMKNGITEVTRVTVVLTPSTEFTSVSRAPDVAPTGWNGDYIEASAAEGTIAQGDFVTVMVRRDTGRPTAVKVQRVLH